MSRLMSVSLTERAVVERRKTVTRRLGWVFLKPGDRLTLCRKVMGRKKGEPLVRLAEVEVVSVRREPLVSITADDVAREGFPEWRRWDFITFYTKAMRVHETDEVTRIEWRYISDGTMRCPIPSPEGLPCQRRIPKGWSADEGHGGGHWWQSDADALAMRTGHYDARAVLAGEPFTVHQPHECPGAAECAMAATARVTP